ncbi:hypothetical protein LVJ94_05160 [Pendulispora rubella]|uniref:Uncharacterized protein n=1 Tax=Pendulispora rubella TaxID=2741070 RepID=A0ABZ2L9Y8_9BACT
MKATKAPSRMKSERGRNTKAEKMKAIADELRQLRRHLHRYKDEKLQLPAGVLTWTAGLIEDSEFKKRLPSKLDADLRQALDLLSGWGEWRDGDRRPWWHSGSYRPMAPGEGRVIDLTRERVARLQRKLSSSHPFPPPPEQPINLDDADSEPGFWYLIYEAVYHGRSYVAAAANLLANVKNTIEGGQAHDRLKDGLGRERSRIDFDSAEVLSFYRALNEAFRAVKNMEPIWTNVFHQIPKFRTAWPC